MIIDSKSYSWKDILCKSLTWGTGSKAHHGNCSTTTFECKSWYQIWLMHEIEVYGVKTYERK